MHEACNIIEKRLECIIALKRLHGSAMPIRANLLNMAPSDSTSSDGFFAGPPCVDLSWLGGGKGIGGHNCSWTLRTLEMIFELSNRRGRPLRWVILEIASAIPWERTLEIIIVRATDSKNAQGARERLARHPCMVGQAHGAFHGDENLAGHRSRLRPPAAPQAHLLGRFRARILEHRRRRATPTRKDEAALFS